MNTQGKKRIFGFFGLFRFFFDFKDFSGLKSKKIRFFPLAFIQSHNIVYKFLLFACFKFKLIAICRESNTVSADTVLLHSCIISLIEYFQKEKSRKTFAPPGM
jgi:hypothetical protein